MGIISEKAMATHSSTLALKIPWTEEPGRLQSMGSLRVRHNWATSISLFTFVHWRRKWQPTPAFLPGESQGQRSLVGCRLWGRTESDTTERLSRSSSMGIISFCWFFRRSIRSRHTLNIFLLILKLKEFSDSIFLPQVTHQANDTFYCVKPKGSWIPQSVFLNSFKI